MYEELALEETVDLLQDRLRYGGDVLRLALSGYQPGRQRW